MRQRANLAVPAKHIAVVGGGWAGCAAAVDLATAGCTVTLFEAARTLGGRARGVEVNGTMIDNGQHILLGAYTETMRLLRKVGVDPKAALLNLPLQMRYPPGSGGMDFVAPRLPAPFHMTVALLRATGLTIADKMSLARFSTTARWMGWQLHADCSVAELLERFDQTERLVQLMWRPLCLAALNTPPERASAQVFLAVLRDSLGAGRSASDMLLPRQQLSALFPQAAAAFIEKQNGAVHCGAKVTALSQESGKWRVDASGQAVGGNRSALFDAVVLAVPPPAAASLLASLPVDGIRDQLAAFAYEPITTCYLQYPAGLRLDLPFYALVDDPAAGHWGQFVFDRGQLDAGQDGLCSVVISASAEAADMGQAALAQAIAAQLAAVLQRPEMAAPQWTQVITEKRATFACTPSLQRLATTTGLDGLVLAGDYTASDYPATLESAVRSGAAAAKAISAPAAS
ncbi:phytoene dehydrogenase [Massilia eurypsychrophila]|jgi:squalene-associated FAD-dependent desaturase|uniref:Phytoene dehydrogenase n=1 Tax=Massilia eurypsychrophila TaxID=1485217 RepID=A0A2G8TFZ0_9BURK|nr:hydroxysqualene dehydroxylase HpnE [Massilia eurypsychrophila]PIL44967.1 phytoene dehydrogenase [Massilia eurypsychrophila]